MIQQRVRVCLLIFCIYLKISVFAIKFFCILFIVQNYVYTPALDLQNIICVYMCILKFENLIAMEWDQNSSYKHYLLDSVRIFTPSNVDILL